MTLADLTAALARVEDEIATAPNSALRDALTERRWAIRQQINEAMGEA